jgi:hypothetical protein
MRQKGPPHYCNSAGFNEVDHILVRSVPPADMEGFETFTNWLSTRYSLPIWISIMPRHELECCMVLAKEIGGGVEVSWGAVYLRISINVNDTVRIDI